MELKDIMKTKDEILAEIKENQEVIEFNQEWMGDNPGQDDEWEDKFQETFRLRIKNDALNWVLNGDAVSASDSSEIWDGKIHITTQYGEKIWTTTIDCREQE